MRLCHSLLLAGSLLIATAASAQTSPNDAMRTCKNEASSRMPNVPLAFITVQRGTNAGDGSYMINFRAQAPNRPLSSGFCIISQRGKVKNFQFDAPMSGGNNGGGIGGNNGGRISPTEAQRACKTEASNRMPQIPLAYISTTRRTDPGDGSYIINFRAQMPNGPLSSGFCNVTWNGAIKNFQYDAPPPSSGTQNFGGQTPVQVMRSCKSSVSDRFPKVPLAFIEVDNPRVNGGSMMSNFRINAPNGFRANGSCDVFQNGHVNLIVR